MKNVIETLDRYYQSFINQKGDWEFFLSLADYAGCIEDTPQLKKLIDNLITKKDNTFKKIEQYEKNAITEIKKAKTRVLEIIRKNKIAYPELKEKISEFEKYENKDNVGLASQVELLYATITAILQSLSEHGYKPLIKEFLIKRKSFEHKEKGIVEYVEEYTFSKFIYLTRCELLDLRKKLNEGIELWTCWGKLNSVYTVIFKADEEKKKIDKMRQEGIDPLIIFGEMEEEMEKIQRAKNSIPSGLSYFIRSNYELPASRIHNYLIQELSKEETKKPAEKQIKKTTLFLNQNGDLYREPKDRYCYPMGEKSNRHRIIRFLATNKGYQFTEFISKELGIESEKTIRTEIGKMRSNIEKYLKIDGKDFLQGKKESGYRINPKYKVIPKNE